MAWPFLEEKEDHFMGGRFGKYGDVKRRQALRQVRREKNRLESNRLRARIRRSRQSTGPLKRTAPRPHFLPETKDQETGRPLDTV